MHVKNQVEKLAKEEQNGSGWMARKMGEIQLVKDAVPVEHHGQLDRIATELERDPSKRRLTGADAGLVHRLHRDYAHPAIQDSLRYESTLERAEQAKAAAAKGKPVRPDATQTDAGQDQVPAPTKRKRKS